MVSLNNLISCVNIYNADNNATLEWKEKEDLKDLYGLFCVKVGGAGDINTCTYDGGGRGMDGRGTLTICVGCCVSGVCVGGDIMTCTYGGGGGGAGGEPQGPVRAVGHRLVGGSASSYAPPPTYTHDG